MASSNAQQVSHFEVSSVSSLMSDRAPGSGGPSTSLDSFLPNLFAGQPNFELPLLFPAIRPSLGLSMEPRMAAGTTGPLGLGWELQLPRIVRKDAQGIDYSAADFSLRTSAGVADLVATDTTTFRPVADDKLLTVNRSRSSFVVRSPDGTTSTFGATPNTTLHDPKSGRVAAWYLDKVVDRQGNVATVEYENIGGRPYIKAISYGSQSNQLPPFELLFSYAPDDLSTASYALGFEDRNALVLQKISIVELGKPVRQYAFVYDRHPEIAAFVLRQVGESGPSGNLTQAFRIDYFANHAPDASITSPGGPTPDSVYLGGTTRRSDLPMRSLCFGGDFTGHGRAEIACYLHMHGSGSGRKAKPSTQWQVASYDGAKWNTSLWDRGTPVHVHRIAPRGYEPYPDWSVHDWCFSGTFDNSGRTGLACYAVDGSGPDARRWTVSLSTGTGWTTSDWEGGPRPAGVQQFGSGKITWGIPPFPLRDCFAGDFEGHGRTGIACHLGGGNWEVALSTGSGWQLHQWNGGPTPSGAAVDSCITGNFNGAGRADIACYAGARGDWQVALSTGTGWLLQTWNTGPAPALPIRDCLTGDFSGDVRTGIACYQGGGQWTVSTPTGSNWYTATWIGGPEPQGAVSTACGTGGFLANRKSGILCHVSNGGWQVGEFTGGPGQLTLWTNGPQPGDLSAQCLVGDILGNGRAGLACIGAGGSMATWTQGGHDAPWAVSTVSLPSGLSIRFDYQWLDPFTQRHLLGPTPVLQSVQLQPAPGDPALELSFGYEDGYYNADQREFRGFGSAVVTYPVGGDGRRKIVRFRFHQGGAAVPTNDDFGAPVALMKGRPYEVSVGDDQDKRYADTVITYRQQARGPSTFIAPLQIASSQCDGNCYLTKTAQYDYDDLGNRVTDLITTSLNGASSAIKMSRRYLRNATGVLGIVTGETVSDATTGKTYSKTAYHYDETVTCGSTLIAHSAGRYLKTSETTFEGDTPITTSIAYDQYGNVICRRLPDGAAFRTAYDFTGNWPRTLTNPLGLTTQIYYYGVDGEGLAGGPLGLASRVVDANGDTIRSEYDELGRKTRETLPDDVSGWVAWDYSSDSGLQVVHATDSAGDETYERRDGLGRLVKLSSRGPEATWLDAEWIYSPTGTVASQRGPALRSVAVKATTYRHDILDRLIETIDPNGEVSKNCFVGAETLQIEPNGEIRGSEIDEHGTISSIFAAESRGASGVTCAHAMALPRIAEVTAGYDSAGRLLQVMKQGRLSTKMTYNALGQVTEVWDVNGGSMSYTYDANGRTKSAVTNGGVSKYVDYDLLGRPTKYTFGDPTSADAVVFVYDSASAHGKGRLAKITFGNTSEVFEYNSIGDATSTTYAVGGTSQRVLRTYDFRHRIMSITALGTQYRLSYDGGILREVDGPSGTILRTSGVSLAGQPTTFDLPEVGTVSLKYQSPIDGQCGGQIARLCEVSATTADGVTTFLETYGYDRVGRVNTVEQPGSRTTIKRDDLGRVTSIENLSSDGSELVRPTESFVFDAFGRIAKSSAIGDYTYDSTAIYAADGPRTIGGQVVTYRKDGRIESIGSTTFDYDDRGLLQAVSSPRSRTTLEYDAMGRLSQVGGQDGTTLFGPDIACANQKCRFALKGVGPFLMFDSNSDRSYAVLDGQGSPRTLHTGTDQKSAIFSAYGQPAGDPGVPQASRTGLANIPFIPELSLYVMGGRAFSPAQSVFLVPEPEFHFSGQSALIGSYVYGNGDPFTYQDRDGRFAWFVPIIVGAILGATAAAANHSNILQGALTGAIGGAFYWVGAELGGGPLAYAFAGGLSGFTNAALFGGDVPQATVGGAIVGVVSAEIFSERLSFAGADNGLDGTIDYTLNSALRGAAAGGAYAAFTGDDIGKGALRGATAGVISAAANMFIGHALGLTLSGFKAPEWNNGAWEYNPKIGSAFTIGNVVVGDEEVLEAPAMSGNHVSLNENGEEANNRGHELGHIPQSETMGLAYLPAIGISYLIGGAFGAATQSGYVDDTHAYSMFENESGFIGVPSFQ
ncbi:hypothetical protein [Rhizobium sp. BK491]|uniref:SpvB/TcaC N-terminal domain-containing protein n=1 Tax=Rhizobium sp. BK491 TaxID=2587009 RepID=UPI0016167703|nr:YD repeat-containing protein [Rhizobium sp. BK491]